MPTNRWSERAFTIVELLVVIVVIGILAAVTIVSYAGINKKAIVSSIQSDLTNSSKQIKLFEVSNSGYPATISTNCSISPDTSTNKCLSLSSGNTPSYQLYNSSSYLLTIINGNSCYSISDNSAPFDNCVNIGSQTWMKTNLNVGRMIVAGGAQTNNSIIEKYCYSNIESNCATFGGLYMWNEAMQYVTTNGAKGICPTGFRIPSAEDYDTLIANLGGDADVVGGYLKEAGLSYWSSPNQGATNSSGFSAVGAGTTIGGVFYNNKVNGYMWSSTEDDSIRAWDYSVTSGSTTIGSFNDAKSQGLSVRCIKN